MELIGVGASCGWVTKDGRALNKRQGALQNKAGNRHCPLVYPEVYTVYIPISDSERTMSMWGWARGMLFSMRLKSFSLCVCSVISAFSPLSHPLYSIPDFCGSGLFVAFCSFPQRPNDSGMPARFARRCTSWCSGAQRSAVDSGVTSARVGEDFSVRGTRHHKRLAELVVLKLNVQGECACLLERSMCTKAVNEEGVTETV